MKQAQVKKYELIDEELDYDRNGDTKGWIRYLVNGVEVEVQYDQIEAKDYVIPNFEQVLPVEQPTYYELESVDIKGTFPVDKVLVLDEDDNELPFETAFKNDEEYQAFLKVANKQFGKMIVEYIGNDYDRLPDIDDSWEY